MRSDSSGLIDKALVDTNVLIYAYEHPPTERQGPAQDLLRRLVREDRLVLSAQTLNEFYSVIRRPNRPGQITHERATAILRHLVDVCLVVPVTPVLTFRALDAVAQHRLSFWDALIWAAARENGIPVLFTEDLQHGADLEGVRIVNPFLAP